MGSLNRNIPNICDKITLQKVLSGVFFCPNFALDKTSINRLNKKR